MPRYDNKGTRELASVASVASAAGGASFVADCGGDECDERGGMLQLLQERRNVAAAAKNAVSRMQMTKEQKQRGIGS